MGSLAPSIRSNNPTSQSANVTVSSAALGGLSGRAYTSDIMCAKIDMSSMALDWTDSGASGGNTSQKLLDFPEGVIRVIGATANITSITTSASATTATAAILFGIGSAATNAGETLDAATEVDILPSTSITLASNTGSGFGVSNATSVLTVLDGHTSAKAAYLNFAASAAHSSATVTDDNSGLVISGTIYIWYINLGD